MKRPTTDERSPGDDELGLTPEQLARSSPEALEAHRELVRLAAARKRLRVREVAKTDQLVAHLRDLEHTIDATHSFELPLEARERLVKAARGLLGSAILGLEWGETINEERRKYEALDDAVDMLFELGAETMWRRLRARATDVAEEVVEHGADEVCFDVVDDDGLIDELIREAGLEPPDDVIRAWLLKHAQARQPAT